MGTHDCSALVEVLLEVEVILAVCVLIMKRKRKQFHQYKQREK
jgi:hypothetical protein